MKINYWQKFIEGGYFHIYNRTVGHDFLFMNHENYRYFLEKWQLYLEKYIEVYAFCLMSNHFHLVIRLNQNEEEVTQAFSNFFNSYAKSVNKENNRTGSLFEKHFKRIKLTDEDYLKQLIVYVHLNPKHHLDIKFEEYKFSSYESFLSLK